MGRGGLVTCFMNVFISPLLRRKRSLAHCAYTKSCKMQLRPICPKTDYIYRDSKYA